MFIAQRTSSYEKTDYEVVKADSAVDLELRFLPLHPANSRGNATNRSAIGFASLARLWWPLNGSWSAPSH